MKKVITHIIYDMDGLLLDTEPFYTQATQEVVEKYGKKFEWSLKSKMMGRPALESARLLVDSLNIPITPEEYLAERKAYLLKLCPMAEPLPGAIKITKKAKRWGIQQAVATSSIREIYDLKTKRHKKWFEIFDVIITGDDSQLNSGKPSPDIYLLASERLKADPKKCLVFEDSPAGLRAASAAGMKTIAVPDANIDKRLFENANHIIDSLEEFDIKEWFNYEPS